MSELPSLPIDGLVDLAGLVGKGRLASQAERPANRGEAAAVQAAKDFESIFLHKLLQEMKNTIPDAGLLGDGTSDQIKDIFWFYLAQDLAERGGLGLWKQIYQQAGLAGGQRRTESAAEQSP